MDEEEEEKGKGGGGGRWHGEGCPKGGPSGVGNDERRCCIRPTQTGPRFKALRAAYLSLPSFFFLPVRATAIYHLRGPVIPSRLRVSDLHRHTHTHAPTRPIDRPRGPPTRQYVRITARRRISFDHIPSLRIIGRANVWGVRPRNSDRSIGRIRNP